MTSHSIGTEDNLSSVVTNYLLVRTILDNFSAKQLEDVRPVCQLWNDIASSFLRNRVYFDPFLLIYDPRDFKLSSEPSTSSDSGGMDGTDKRLFLNNLIGSQGIYVSKRKDAFPKLARFCKEIMSTVPNLCALFISNSNFISSLVSEKILPSNCHQLIVCSRAGIVGQPSLAAKPFELDRKLLKLEGISSSFVARQWGDFEIFITDWHDAQNREPNPNDADYPVKCAIIFSTNVEDNKKFNSWLNSSQSPIPMGGALVDLLVCNRKWPSFITVSFAGRNIKAASFILDTETIDEGETKLNEFKRSLDFDTDDTSPHIKTIGFLFICAGRGADHYRGHLNVESNLVHKVFPHILFSGVLGNGEYGWNCYNYPNRDQQYKSLSLNHLTLSYTTVIVLVQFSRRPLQ